MLRLDFKTVCARAKKLKPHIEISHNSRLDHSEIIDLSYRAKKDDCTMTVLNAFVSIDMEFFRIGTVMDKVEHACL